MGKILGIRVERDRVKGTLKISSGLYINVVLTQFYMQDVNPILMPLSKSVKLMVPIESTNGPTIDVPYAKAISSLMYVALGTQPDLAFAVQHLSQFTMSYGPEHWTVVKHMLWYLKGTQDDGLTYTLNYSWMPIM